MVFNTGIAGFVGFILNALLDLLFWALILNAVMSWLLAFNVINYNNAFVRGLGRLLDAVTRPILWPLRKVIPNLGGVDITPIIAVLIIRGVQFYLLPPFIVFIAQFTG